MSATPWRTLSAAVPPLTEPERRALRRLAADLKRVWAAPSTTDRDRTDLLRTLLDDVVITVGRTHHHATVESVLAGRRAQRVARQSSTTQG